MSKIRGATVRVICKNKSCKAEFTARVADRKRGWARFCSKSCKATVQERKTGQMAEFLCKKPRAYSGNYIFGAAEDGK